jgi:hypothetical protein
MARVEFIGLQGIILDRINTINRIEDRPNLDRSNMRDMKFEMRNETIPLHVIHVPPV